MTRKRLVVISIIVLVVGLGCFSYFKVKNKVNNLEKKLAEEFDKGSFDDLLSELEQDEEIQKIINEELNKDKTNDEAKQSNDSNDKENIDNTKINESENNSTNQSITQKPKTDYIKEQNTAQVKPKDSNKIENSNENDNSKDNVKENIEDKVVEEDRNVIEQDSIIANDKKNVEETEKEENKVINKQKKQHNQKENNENIGDNKQSSLDRIKQLEKHVDIGDKSIGFKLAAKVDVPYLLRLAQGGITSDDKAKVKAHLKERLSTAEYNQAKALIYKYLKLMDDNN